MSLIVTSAGVVTEWWNDDERVYRRWDLQSQLLEQRPYTSAEAQRLDQAADAQAEAVRRAVFSKALAAALERNQAYASLGTPTVAQRAAQVDDLTRQVGWLIRLVANVLGDPQPTSVPTPVDLPDVPPSTTSQETRP